LTSLPRRPLCATRFPYTTLFRSRVSDVVRPLPGVGRIADVAARVDERAAEALVDRDALREIERQLVAGVRLPRQPVAQRPLVVLDRKSTRLNSSHQIISYAVFCL